MTVSREGMPKRIRALPVDPVRGFPVPWFVAWVDGKPEFRAADRRKLVLAVRERRCWVCGQPIGREMTFVVGPMCGLNRTSAEPPSHAECGQYSARVCPFLSRPHMERRAGGLEEIGTESPAGHMIRRNPGVTLLWTTLGYELFDDGRGGTLFRIGDPVRLQWFCEGRAATRAEVEESVSTGLPAFEEMAHGQDAALDVLRAMAAKYTELYPKARR